MLLQQAGTGLWHAITDRTAYTYVGVLAGTPGTERDLEIGVWITPARWSTGLANEALRAALAALREQHPTRRLVAEADVKHDASDRLLRRVGFEVESQGVDGYGNHVRHYLLVGDLKPPEPSSRVRLIRDSPVSVAELSLKGSSIGTGSLARSESAMRLVAGDASPHAAPCGPAGC